MQLKQITPEQLDKFQDFVEGTLRGMIMNIGEGYMRLGDAIDAFKVLNEIMALRNALAGKPIIATKEALRDIMPMPPGKIEVVAPGGAVEVPPGSFKRKGKDAA